MSSASHVSRHSPFRYPQALFGICCALFLALAGVPETALADVTEISLFTSHVLVRSDGSILVTERIGFRCEDDSPPPERSFPLVYADHAGDRTRLHPHVLSVTMDGADMAFHIREDAEANVLAPDHPPLSSGSHVLELRYEADRQLRFLSDRVRLYWPVTGYQWAIPIDRVEASVELPLLVNVLERRGFTGPEPARGDAYAMGENSDGLPWFRSTRRLYPGDGLVLLVNWPKGFVTEPWIITRLWHSFRDNRGIIMAMLGVILLAAGQLRTWNRLSAMARIPRRSALPPVPPKFTSPAGLRAALGLPLDAKCMAATLLSLAISGVIRVKMDSGYILLARTGTSLKRMGRVASDVCTALFEAAGPDVPVELPAVSRTGIRSLSSVFKAMRRAATTEAFLAKTRFLALRLAPSLIISAIILTGLAISAERTGLASFLLGWLVASHLMVLSFILAIARGKAIRPARRTLLLLLTALPFAVFELVMLLFFSHTISTWAAVLFAVTLVLNTAFFFALRRHVFRRGPHGAELAMFRARLEAGAPAPREPDSQDDSPAVPGSPEPFPGATSLPFALVLDMEELWDRFFRLTDSCAITPGDGAKDLEFLLSRLCEAGGAGLGRELIRAIETNPPHDRDAPETAPPSLQNALAP